METGVAGIVHRAADALHLLTAAVWLGALLPFLMLLRAARHNEQAAKHASRRLSAFHNIGLAAVLALLGTGLVNSWFLVGSMNRLVSTAYGKLLLVKLLLFAAMVGLAAWNRLKLVPDYSRDIAAAEARASASTRLRAHIGTEFILGLLVLLIVGILGAIEPAAE